MAQGVQTVLYPVQDVEVAKKIFGALLGVEPIADAPYYVGYQVHGQDIGLIPGGAANGMTGPVPYWHVEDIHASFAALLAAGAAAKDEPNDVGGGRLVASVLDPDGNPIGLVQG